MANFFTRKSTYETILRYFLGLMMLPYGISKILRTQFIILPFYAWSQPLKDISGSTLTWAFLGYSPWFTILLGLLEAVPATLLLFRKTKLLGALLLFPISLNVFLINIALDLWPGTQLISGILLSINIVLLLFHYELLIDFFKRILNHLLVRSRRIKLEIVVNIILIVLVSSAIVPSLMGYIKEQDFLTGDWYNSKPYYWLRADSKELTTQFITDTEEQDFERYYFQSRDGVYVFGQSESRPTLKNYKLDDAEKKLSVTGRKDSTNVLSGSYQLINDSIVAWDIDEGEKRIYLIRKKLE